MAFTPRRALVFFFLIVPLFFVVWENVRGETGFDVHAYAKIFTRKAARNP